MVIIRSTGQQAFHQLLPADTVAEMAVGEEVEWFTDVMESIIGTIGLGGKNTGWNYALLKPDTRGDFQVSERQRNFLTHHAARIALWRRMVEDEVLAAQRLAA
jgi:predicted short-subunit dehydrogenase-like oxidoreductase (DUF2520 family)